MAKVNRDGDTMWNKLVNTNDFDIWTTLAINTSVFNSQKIYQIVNKFVDIQEDRK